jgi:hypothetical protein
MLADLKRTRPLEAVDDILVEVDRRSVIALPFVRTCSADQLQQALSKFTQQSIHLEILAQGLYCIYSQYSSTAANIRGILDGEMNACDPGDPFCSNPSCVLHVSAGTPGVVGWGQWAELPNGLIVGRGLLNGVPVCDLCWAAMRDTNDVAVSQTAALQIASQ